MYCGFAEFCGWTGVKDEPGINPYQCRLRTTRGMVDSAVSFSVVWRTLVRLQWQQNGVMITIHYVHGEKNTYPMPVIPLEVGGGV